MATILSILIVFFSLLHSPLAAQQKEQRKISSFKKLMVGDGIDLFLNEGDGEALYIEYSGVDSSSIITKVVGSRLKIFLDKCRSKCKRGVYQEVKVKAYLTFKQLDKLSVHGDNQVVCLDTIYAQKFTLRALGNNVVRLKAVSTHRLKTALYGDCEVHIEGGCTRLFRVKSMGNNNIVAKNVVCQLGKIASLGDSRIDIYAQKEVAITILGDSEIHCYNNPKISKNLVWGDMNLFLANP